MGSLVSAIREASGVANKDDITTRLELLLVAAKAKIRGYRDEIDESFMNPAQIERIQIPGIRSIRYIEQYHVASSSSFSDQVAGHLEAAVDAFFSIGGNADNKDAVKKGIQSLISGALDGFIGSIEAGETEESIYIVVPENNAFIRADIRLWKYHLTDKNIADNQDTAVAYVLCKSVIDHTKIALDELIYLATDAMSKRSSLRGDVAALAPDHFKAAVTAFNALTATSTDADRKSATDKITEALPRGMTYVYDKDRKIVCKVTFGSDGKPTPPDPSRPVLLPLVDMNSPVHSDPASLTAVEAYIEEMIRVWKKLKSADA